jgi:hypothetical protein
MHFYTDVLMPVTIEACPLRNARVWTGRKRREVNTGFTVTAGGNESRHGGLTVQ